MNAWHQTYTLILAELGSILLILGGIFNYIPGVAILLGIVWYAINIYEWGRKVYYRRKL